jgi:hypothetical protein
MPTLQSIYNKGVIFIPQWDVLSQEAVEMAKEFKWGKEARKVLK